MNEVENLIEKWLADEITPLERDQLAQHAALDPEVAHTLAALEQHDKTLAILRLGPAAPFDMANAVLRQVQNEKSISHRTSILQRIKSLWTSQWTWSAPRAAAIAVVLLAVGILVGRLTSPLDSIPLAPSVDPPSTTVAAAQTTAANLQTENETQSMVRFVFRAERAASVAIVGDFNDWNDRAHLLQRAADSDLWTTTVPLKKGMYEYMFVVDGTQWKVDPLATRFRDDGFGNKNAVLEL